MFGGIILAPFLITIIPSTPWNTETQSSLTTLDVDIPPYRQTINEIEPASFQPAPAVTAKPVKETGSPREQAPVEPASAEPSWQSVTVAAGENMSLIFDRLGLGPTELYKVLHTDEQTASLKNLVPGQELRFRIEEDSLQALEYEKDLTTTLVVNKEENGFSSELVTTPLTKKVVDAEATIHQSLYLAGKNAGMSDNLIMQLVALYGWDIDFAMNIRSGDHFKLLYEQHFKDGVLVREGPILAADFNNRGRSVRAVRYTDPEGNTDYYAEDGASMRKAFLRNPLDVFRISSHFNPRRRHPVLNTIRAHRGTDYAAPTGTPVRATGDGSIVHIGRKGGYGNAIVLKHGGRYSTLYGHMSRYARSLRQGSRVKQGQIIGYVGSSGLATGPHLHYEFQVNGVHRNPLTVKLPKADSIPAEYVDDFKLKSRTLLAELESGSQQAEKTILALREEQPEEQLSPDNNSAAVLTIGLMSGTSMDAIDAALVRFDNSSLSILKYRQYPINDDIRRAVRALSSQSDIEEISRLDHILGELFADATLRIIREAGLATSDIDAVGSHGQTVLHLPDADRPRTLQIGDPNIIALRSGITTIADFRRMDMAAGGQGAPLAPAFHNEYLRNTDKNRIILNIGGIANITILPRDKDADITGFDTGPGNGLLDDWNFRHNRTQMDKDGAWAGSGNVDENLLECLLEDPYFALPPPKSSGRDHFNLAWLDGHLQTQGHTLPAEDVQATLLQLSVRTIADAVTRHAAETGEIYVCGGGVHNPLLMTSLAQHLPAVKIASTGDIGIDPDAVEAVTFAWLAKCRLEGVPGNLPSVTGAKKPVLLGGIYSASDKSQVTSYK